MIKKLIVVLTLSLLFAARANAAVLSITGPAHVYPGDSFELQIWGDFSGEGLVGGGIFLAWDSGRVQLDNIELNLPVLDNLSCPGASFCPPNSPLATPIVWSELLVDLIAPDDPAPTLMATLGFSAVGIGTAAYSMTAYDKSTGGWFGSALTPIPTPTFG